MIRFELPLKTVSTANLRECWQARSRRTRAERQAATLLTPRGIKLPCSILLTRVAPRQLDDDNLRSCFKGIRDGIADKLGVKDNDWRVMWDYAQENGRAKEYSVIVQITSQAQVEPHLRAIV